MNGQVVFWLDPHSELHFLRDNLWNNALMVEVFVDQQSLGIRKYLKAIGIEIRDDSVIRGTNDTSKGIPDDQVQEFITSHPGVVLITQDRKFARQASRAGLKVVFVDQSKAVATEAIRQLAESDFLEK